VLPHPNVTKSHASTRSTDLKGILDGTIALQNSLQNTRLNPRKLLGDSEIIPQSGEMHQLEPEATTAAATIEYGE